MIGSHESKAKHACRCSQETIGRILVRKRQFLSHGDDFVCQRSFAHVCGCSRDPVSRVAVQLDSTFGLQQQNFPRAHGGQPQVVVLIFQFVLHAPRELLRLRQAPNPNVRVEEEFQFFKASIVSVSITGETISPTISMLPAIEPIQLLSSASQAAGMTSASGWPRRVTRIGVLVLLTSSSNDRHLALNLEIAISCIGFLILFRIGNPYGFVQNTMVNRYSHQRKCALKPRIRVKTGRKQIGSRKTTSGV
jgi:hypothetical protein